MLLVDFDAPSHLRALARFDKTRLERRSNLGGGLLGKGHMAFTIDPGGDINRYQGVIDGEGHVTLAEQAAARLRPALKARFVEASQRA